MWETVSVRVVDDAEELRVYAEQEKLVSVHRTYKDIIITQHT